MSSARTDPQRRSMTTWLNPARRHFGGGSAGNSASASRILSVAFVPLCGSRTSERSSTWSREGTSPKIARIVRGSSRKFAQSAIVVMSAGGPPDRSRRRSAARAEGLEDSGAAPWPPPSGRCLRERLCAGQSCAGLGELLLAAVAWLENDLFGVWVDLEHPGEREWHLTGNQQNQRSIRLDLNDI